MTSSQIILVSVTSALIAVFAMLLVASLKRARSEERDDEPIAPEGPTSGAEQGKEESAATSETPPKQDKPAG